MGEYNSARRTGLYRHQASMEQAQQAGDLMDLFGANFNSTTQNEKTPRIGCTFGQNRKVGSKKPRVLSQLLKSLTDRI